MQESFQPRKVSSTACLTWCTEALFLSVRHPLRNTLIAVFFSLPYLYLPGSEKPWLFILFLIYNLLCPPILFSILVVASYCSDYSESLLPRLYSTTQLLGALKTVAIYGLIITAVLVLGSLVFVALLATNLPYLATEASSQYATEALKPAFLSFPPGEKLWWSLAIYLCFGAATWFIAPLMCIAHCPFSVGVKLAYRTLIKNPFMFWLPLIITITLSPLCWLSGIFTIPAVIIIGMLVYCSFRDIFMGRKHSFPVTANRQATAIASQH